ncbi:DUF1772 domain-containing protein [Granulicella sp. WH15]|uniref:DUF1772 domain-containing protein n=1 Tax=Granulicella sp. WH15 TaxID=2602070 RepID=UPI0013669BCA|nr:DUF1772 domain-containing protein [Granulicella sp. WH15]QHN05066.1 DUF1772 domain-containing protein [Granulicella sp. WH15]
MTLLLDVFTILSIGLMTGNEFAVSAFVNPAIWKLDDRAQVSLLARSLGRAMPFWYALNAILLGVEAWLRSHTPGHLLLLSAELLWVATIVFTILLLVPINNRLGADSEPDSDPGWRSAHKRWDILHRIRIAALTVAVICFLYGILQTA